MSVKGKRILVTGDSGFVGSHLVEGLKQKGAEVVSFKSSDGHRIDLRDWESIRGLDDLDIIYHLAGVTYVPFCFVNPRETYEVNVLGTLNMLELSRLCDVEKFVFASSYVYGHPQYLPVDEKHPVQPTNPYAGSKVAAERLCSDYNRDFGIKCAILRFFNIYGEGQSNNFLIPKIAGQLRNGKVELEDPGPKRDFIYISDVIDAYIKSSELDANYEIFNIGYGKSYSVEEIVNKMVRLWDRDVEVHYSDNRRTNEIMDIVSDIGKAEDKLNWKPQVSIEAGLRKMTDMIQKRATRLDRSFLGTW